MADKEKSSEQADTKTLKAYDKDAFLFAKQWHDSPPPTEIYEVITKFFDKSKTTIEIGSGSGRDAAWLKTRGFSVIGFDASQGLLDYSRKRYGHIEFKFAELPLLKEIESNSADQILCATAIQHLAPQAIPIALNHLDRVLKVDGILFLSWRVPLTNEKNYRLEDERLYTKIEFEEAQNGLSPSRFKELYRDETDIQTFGKLIRTLVVKKLSE